MTAYFKNVNDLAEWVSEPCTKSYVLPEQKDRARKMLVEGGGLLSYIKGVRCWAGVSRIVAGTKLRESAGDTVWERAFPFYFDIEPLYVLQTQEKCFLARESLLRSGYHGRNIYSHMWKTEVCERIRGRIEQLCAITKQEAESEARADGSFQSFQHDWEETKKRSSFSSGHTIRLSGGKCSICDVTKQEWVERIVRGGKWPSGLSLDRIRSADFKLLQAHHLAPVKDGGTSQLDNLLAVCPNCHDLITRAARS